MQPFLTGLQFLTRITLKKQIEWTPQNCGRSVKYFPLIGMILGLIYASAAYVLYFILPVYAGLMLPHVFAAFILVLPILCTGGLHCDGFMDTMDGLFSGRSRERILEIMRDSRVGANGIMAFVALIVLDFACLLDIDKYFLLWALFFMPIIARLMMGFAVNYFPYARPEGMGCFFARYASKKALCLSAIIVFCMTLFCKQALVALLLSFGFTLCLAQYSNSVLGGLTGDVYGAITLLNETLVLAIFTCLGQFY